VPAPKKRRVSTGEVGSVSDRPILLLDDDPFGDDEPEPEPRARLAIARKSVGEQPLSRRGVVIEALESQRQVADLQRKLKACQDALGNQRRLIAESQLDHANTIQRFRQDLELARQQQRQQQNRTQLSGDDLETLQRTQDELRVVKRQKRLLSEEIQNVKDQRDEQVSSLNMEIETLKMRLEQHEETIRRLEMSSGRNENMEPSPILHSKYHGTDSV
jgi:chromosome segregation ATPase